MISTTRVVQPRIGVMQGRLSPRPEDRLQAFPWNTWEAEFDSARDSGFDFIEWIFEAEGAPQNPIWTADGQRQIRQKISETGITVSSVCADFFMVHRLAGVSEVEARHNVDILEQLIARTAELGAKRILLPLLETAAIDTPEQQAQARESLRRCIPAAERFGVTLGLEMDVPGKQYAEFVTSLQSPRIRAYYDTGNSAAQGYDIAEDVKHVLPFLEAVHVKDRELFGGSRLLGEGVANFSGFFSSLDAAGFRGDFLLQSYFGDDYLFDTLRNFNYLRLQLGRARRKAA